MKVLRLNEEEARRVLDLLDNLLDADTYMGGRHARSTYYGKRTDDLWLMMARNKLRALYQVKEETR